VTHMRDMIFGQEVDNPKPLIRGRFIAFLAFTLLFAAWHYGIVASVAHALSGVAIGIWHMLRDLAAALEDFLQFVSNQRNH
jgi:hypothetical protein